MFKRFLKRLFLPPLIILAAMLMFFEEWLWNHLVTFTKWVARARFFRWMEAKLAALPPYGAMAILLGPAVLLIPIKLIALYLITHHHAGQGVMIIIAAKIVGTAIVARLFTVCRPKLLSIQWFRRLFEAIIRTKERLYAYIKSMPAWKVAVRMKNRIKSWMPRGGRFRRMWKAIGEVLRKKFFPKSYRAKQAEEEAAHRAEHAAPEPSEPVARGTMPVTSGTTAVAE